MVNIYCLIDPRTNTPFYVGATRRPLIKRLYGHIGQANTNNGRGHGEKRAQIIRAILAAGLRPCIQLLCTTTPEHANHLEQYFYRYFTAQGIELQQSIHFFNYSVKYG
jgi:hypothetical protein